MPQIFKIGSYCIYFWSNEGDPLECIHVHIAEGKPSANATKLWITQSGNCLLCNNNSHIASGTLRTLIRMIEANSKIVVDRWYSHFGRIDYYC